MEKGSLPDVTGVIQLVDVEISLGEVLNSVKEAFAPTADPEDQAEEYEEQRTKQQKAMDEAKKDDEDLAKFNGRLNGVSLVPGPIRFQ